MSRARGRLSEESLWSHEKSTAAEGVRVVFALEEYQI